MDDDPGIELPEIGIRVRTRCLRLRILAEGVRDRSTPGCSEAHNEHACALQETSAIRAQDCFDVFRNSSRRVHNPAFSAGAGRPLVIACAARLIAAWIR